MKVVMTVLIITVLASAAAIGGSEGEEVEEGSGNGESVSPAPASEGDTNNGNGEQKQGEEKNDSPDEESGEKEEEGDKTEKGEGENPSPDSETDPPSEGKISKPNRMRTLCALGYTTQGTDDILPEHFFRGGMVIGEAFLSKSGFTIAAKNFTSVTGGNGDRTTLSLSFQQKFGMLNTLMRHRWVHRNTNGDFFSGDRHRTELRAEIPLGFVQPFAVVSSDIPAHTPINEGTVYGGGGLDLRFPLNPLKTIVSVRTSFIGSMFWYHAKPKALYRGSVGFATRLTEGLIISPRISILKDAFSSDCISWISIGFGLTN